MRSHRYPRTRPAPPSAFAGYRFPPEVITLAIRWYLRFGLSYRDVEELLAERRWLSGWGIAAILLTLAACLLALFGHHPITTYVGLVAPIAVQELVLAAWLIRKGFTVRVE